MLWSTWLRRFNRRRHEPPKRSMPVTVSNIQREAPVNAAAMGRLARKAARHLKIRTPGTLAIAFISRRRMRSLNQQFLRHNWETDVLSFRYEEGSPVVGDILVAPGMARRYAKQHGLAYAEELARYVVHGLLHWVGHLDGTPQQEQRMRRLENKLLVACGVLRNGY